MEQRQTQGGFRSRARARRRIEYPDIKGRLEARDGPVQYEVLQVSNGNALVWLEQEHPARLRTASGGFGWVEPVGNLSEEIDLAAVRSRIERRLRSHLPTAAVSPSV